ncbi:MAG TPA: DUF952 domain-containing protein [Candidatus Limnocylindrales bacterium]|jgi:hypothetical protein
MDETFHLTPAEWWAAADPALPLLAPSLADEGFIHCTTGAAEMVATANRHYRDDPREFVIVTVDLGRVSSRWSADDERRVYPHVFGPIDRPAILDVRPMPRDDDGTFLPFRDDATG